MLLIEDSLDGIVSPQDYLYIKLVRLALRSVGFWPGFKFKEKTWKYARYYGIYPIMANSMIFISTIAYIAAHGAEFNFLDRGHMYINACVTGVAVFRSYALPLNSKFQNIIVKFLTSTHLFYHADKSEYARSVHIRIHKICHVVTLILFGQMMVGLSLFNVIPIYMNYSKGKMNYDQLVNSTFELAVYLYFPVDATTNRQSYNFLATFNWYVSYVCSCIICMNDLILFLLVFHVYGHFKILLNLMETLPRPAGVQNQMYSETESVDVSIRLKECIDYYKFLLDFIDSMSEAFGPMLLMYFAFHQVCCCLLLLECSQMSTEALIRYGPLTFIVFQLLIQVCVIFEIIGTVSEKLRDQVYEMPWECMDIKNRKIVLFFLMNVQNPIHVKAMGITDVGVRTMATILKTSVSYFAFLRTFPDTS